MDHEGSETRVYEFFNSRIGRMERIRKRQEDPSELDDLADDEFFFKIRSPPPNNSKKNLSETVEIFSPTPVISHGEFKWEDGEDGEDAEDD